VTPKALQCRSGTRPERGHLKAARTCYPRNWSRVTQPPTASAPRSRGTARHLAGAHRAPAAGSAAGRGGRARCNGRWTHGGPAAGYRRRARHALYLGVSGPGASCAAPDDVTPCPNRVPAGAPHDQRPWLRLPCTTALLTDHSRIVTTHSMPAGGWLRRSWLPGGGGGDGRHERAPAVNRAQRGWTNDARRTPERYVHVTDGGGIVPVAGVLSSGPLSQGAWRACPPRSSASGRKLVDGYLPLAAGCGRPGSGEVRRSCGAGRGNPPAAWPAVLHHNPSPDSGLRSDPVRSPGEFRRPAKLGTELQAFTAVVRESGWREKPLSDGPGQEGEA